MLLTMTLLAFSSPTLDFGPLVLARPLWALLLLHSWQIIGQRRGNAWFAWSIEAGLLLLTTPAAIFLLLLIVVFALATADGRRTLRAFDPLFALVVVAVLALPYAVWLTRAEALVLPALPEVAQLNARALHAAWLLGAPARCGGDPGADRPQHRPVRAQERGGADHLPPAGRAART